MMQRVYTGLLYTGLFILGGLAIAAVFGFGACLFYAVLGILGASLLLGEPASKRL